VRHRSTFNGSEIEGLKIRKKYYSYLLDQREKALVLAKDITLNGLETEGLSQPKMLSYGSEREDCWGTFHRSTFWIRERILLGY
jgi:hypothetical protein